MKVYVIRYEERTYSGYSSGICAIYSTLEKAREYLNMLKTSQIEYYSENNMCGYTLYEEDDELLFEFYDTYDKYVLEERVVK